MAWGAIISGVLGIGKSTLDSKNQRYATATGRINSNVDFERMKEASLYTTYRNQQIAILVIAILGLIFLGFIIYKAK